MGTCTFIDYMIGTISFSRLYKMDTVFFCDFCTAVQCAPKLGVFYLSAGNLQICLRECILQALKPTHGTHWVQQQLEHWLTASGPVQRRTVMKRGRHVSWSINEGLGMTCAAAKQCRVENVYSYIGNDLYQGQVTQVVKDNLVAILVKANICIHDYKH